jgi:methanogenic corrinoid protein MtbC1
VELCAGARLPPTANEVRTFAKIAMGEDVPGALAFVQEMASGGVSLEVIFLHLLTPAARLLGEQWEDDETSFTEVTLGLSTIQQIVQILGPSFSPAAQERGFVLLMAPAPEQHTLGIYLVGEFLRRAGWGVQVAPNLSETDLLALLETQRVDMVGISVSNTDLLRPVTRMVAAVKKASVNPDVLVMLGGSAELADHATEIGATFCSDPRDAVRWLEQHVKIGDVGR